MSNYQPSPPRDASNWDDSARDAYKQDPSRREGPSSRYLPMSGQQRPRPQGGSRVRESSGRNATEEAPLRTEPLTIYERNLAALDPSPIPRKDAPKKYGAGYFKSRFYDDPSDDLPSEEYLITRLKTLVYPPASVPIDALKVLDATEPLLRKFRFAKHFESVAADLARILHEHFVIRRKDKMELPSVQNTASRALSICFVQFSVSQMKKNRTSVVDSKKLVETDQVAEYYAQFVLHQAIISITDMSRLETLFHHLEDALQAYQAVGVGYRVPVPIVAAYIVLRTKIGHQGAALKRFVWPQASSVLQYLDKHMANCGLPSTDFAEPLNALYAESPTPDLPASLERLQSRFRALVAKGSEEQVIDLWRRIRDHLGTASPHKPAQGSLMDPGIRSQVLLACLQAVRSSRFGDNLPQDHEALELASDQIVSMVERPFSREILHALIANRARVIGSAPEVEVGSEVYAMDKDADERPFPMSRKETALKNLHDVWALANEKGAERDVKMYLLFMEGLGRLGDLNALQRAWNAMLTDEVCKGILAKEEPQSTFPPVRALNQMLAATMNVPVNGPPVAEELFMQATKPDSLVPCNIVTINIMLRQHARKGDITGMQSLFGLAGRLDLKPDIVTFTTLVQGLLRAGQVEMAKNTLRSMHAAGLHPEERMCTVLISDLTRTGTKSGLEHAEAMMREMKRCGIEIGIVTWTALISGYFRGGWVEDGWDAVRRLEETDLRLNRVAYNVILRQAGLRMDAMINGKPNNVRIFEKMVSDGVRPNSTSYKILLTPLVKMEMWNETDRIVHTMEALGFRPDQLELRNLLKRVKFRRNLDWATPKQAQRQMQAEGEVMAMERRAETNVKAMLR